MHKRLNIGLLIDDIDAVFTSEAVKGAELGAIAIDANVFIFPGMYLDGVDISDEHEHYEYQYNTLFKFVSGKHIDVLYVMMGMIGCRITEAERYKFLEQYLGIPVVTLYTRMDGYQSIIFDNKKSFKREIKHLILEHGAKNVGYVSGPKTNVDAMERFEAYREALAETDIPYRDEYVVYGNFEESSEDLIGAFVREHPELDAVAFANDRMALGGYKAFAKMGIKVGQELLVVSFDNSEFASTLVPSLTTIEANAAELAYKAVVGAGQMVESGRMDDVRVDTHLIIRSSCGCKGYDIQTVAEQMGLYNLVTAENIQEACNRINTYLFGSYAEGRTLAKVKNEIAGFVKLLVDMVKNNRPEERDKEVKRAFLHILTRPLYRYTTIELLANALKIMQYELCRYVETDNRRLYIMELFSDFYRELAIANWQVVRGQKAGMEKMTKQINGMTFDMFRIYMGERIPYERALDNLSLIGINTAYMYTFTKPIRHPRHEEFKLPDRMLLRAYYKDGKACAVSGENNSVETESIFAPERLPEDRRLTMVMSPLFSGEELYGVLLSETHFEYFVNLEPIAMQISVALKSLILLEQQEQIQNNLKEDMNRIEETNDMLKEVSRTDQLTGVKNRLGYLEYVKNAVVSAENQNKKAYVLYGDMDNLKMINDVYGHDDGDFALKTIAAILKDAFEGMESVVGRFGGDEFVVFALSDTLDEAAIKAAVKYSTEKYNKMFGKPYPIEMSCGICEIFCNPEINIYDVLSEADRKLYQEKREKKSKQGSYR